MGDIAFDLKGSPVILVPPYPGQTTKKQKARNCMLISHLLQASKRYAQKLRFLYLAEIQLNR
ncbi:hypothetical protein LWT33_22355, partial [Enterobacter hormaechei]|nr:hypothetical protein [Enterobacter hormaechei]